MRLHLNLDGVALCCVLFLRVSGFVQQKHREGRDKVKRLSLFPCSAPLMLGVMCLKIASF